MTDDLTIETVCPICLGPVDVPPIVGEPDEAPTYDAAAAVAAHIESLHAADLGEPLPFNPTPGALDVAPVTTPEGITP